MVKKVSAAQAKAPLSALAAEVALGGQQVVIEGQLHSGFWGQWC